LAIAISGLSVVPWGRVSPAFAGENHASRPLPEPTKLAVLTPASAGHIVVINTILSTLLSNLQQSYIVRLSYYTVVVKNVMMLDTTNDDEMRW
jgi:hypothetical protein